MQRVTNKEFLTYLGKHAPVTVKRTGNTLNYFKGKEMPVGRVVSRGIGGGILYFIFENLAKAEKKAERAQQAADAKKAKTGAKK